jgi:hypothetical protein
MVKVKVSQFLYKPEESLDVPGGCSSQISWQSAYKCGKTFNPIHRPPLPPQEIILIVISVKGLVDFLIYGYILFRRQWGLYVVYEI